MLSVQFYNYIIYENGDVYSLYRHKYLKGDIVQGYKCYSLTINGKTKSYKAHRLVARWFVPNYNPEINNVVNHIDGNKLNICPSNLEWCTVAYNNEHARKTGLNNINQSNKDRWNDDKFKESTSKNLSEYRKRIGSFKGKSNPKYRYCIILDGIEVTVYDLAKRIKKATSTTFYYVNQYVQGKYVKSFENLNLIIIDTRKSQQTIETKNVDKRSEGSRVDTI